MSSYQYKGWDWTELAVGFRICKAKKVSSAGDDEEKLAVAIRKAIDESIDALTDTTASKSRKRAAKLKAESIRRFLRAMIKGKYVEAKPMWIGLEKCDDEAVLKYTHVLLGYMWT